MKNFTINKLNVLLPPALTTISILSIMIFYSMRFTWVFIDNTLGISGFAFGLMIVFILNAIMCAILTYSDVCTGASKGKKNTAPRTIILILGVLLTLLSFIVAGVYTITIGVKESSYVTQLYFQKELFRGAFFIIIPFALLFLPKFSKKNRTRITSIILVFVIISGIFTLFPITPYEITSSPTVFDNGKEYSVVFSTNKPGTGYVEYSYKGKDYKVYDESNGRLNCDSLIHSINIPYEHLRNNTYTIGSTHIIEEYSYGSRQGKEITSREYTFQHKEDKNLSYLVISDWHTELEMAYKAISYTGDFDGIILMGDSSPGVDFEEEVVRNTVEFSGEISNGSVPVIYTRGNHETRGAYAAKLCDALGLQEFFYTADAGDYRFIVLDSGEDKEDAHPEYGGLVDYKANRTKMINWLKSEKSTDKKTIALSHSWKISDVEEELSHKAWNEIDRLGARLIISGHTHECRLIGETDEKEKAMLKLHPDIIGYMDGGTSDGIYVTSKLTLSPESFTLEAYSNKGEKVFHQNFEW